MPEVRTLIRPCPKCERYACVCAIRAAHKENCAFRIAATSAVGIECPHGRDTCPICDACTCGAGINRAHVGRYFNKGLLPRSQRAAAR